MSDDVTTTYGRLAGRYIELFDNIDSVHPDDIAFIERHLGGASGRVIDVGCGPGQLTAHLRSLGLDAAGIDPVPEFIEHARVAHPDAEFEVGSLADIAGRGTSAAGVLAWYSLVHLPPDEMGRALTITAQLIEPGGSLVIGCFDGPDGAPFDHKVTTAYTWSADELAERLRSVGLLEVDRHRRPADGDTRAHFALAVRHLD